MTAQRSADVLEQIWDAGERPVGQSGGDGVAAVVVEPVDDGVERRISRLRPGDRRVQQLRRRDLPIADEFRQTERVVLLVLGKRFHRTTPGILATLASPHWPRRAGSPTHGRF